MIINTFKDPALFNGYIALCALLFAVFEIKIKVHNEAVKKLGNSIVKSFLYVDTLKVKFYL